MTETANAKEQTPIIFLDDIRVVFNTRTGSILHPNKVTAVDGLTIKLMPGETIGIVGESGCGKSTTANVMCGLQGAYVWQGLLQGCRRYEAHGRYAQDHRPRYFGCLSRSRHGTKRSHDCS